MDDVIPLTERGNIHVANTGIEQYFQCVYSGQPCHSNAPVVHLHGLDSVESPGLVFIELDSVEAFVTSLNESDTEAIEHADAIEGDGRPCIVCGQGVDDEAIAFSRYVDGDSSMPRVAQALLRDVESVQPSVLCHEACFAELAAIIERIWDEMDTMLTDHL